MIGNLIAVVLALINFYIRYKNGAMSGATGVGIWLSLVTVLLLLFNGESLRFLPPKQTRRIHVRELRLDQA